MFKPNNNYSKGRPPGSRNIAPCRKETVELLNIIVSDIKQNYDTLDIDNKLRLLNTFRHLWATFESDITTIPDNTIKVNIIKCQD